MCYDGGMIKKAGILFGWAAGFAVFATAYFYILFDFFIWSPAHWAAMLNSVIRGAKGLAFGASLAAALPVFLASCYYIWKNQKLPFPIPKFKSKKSDEAAPAAAELQTVKYNFPDILPDEIKEPYIRILTGQLHRNASDFMKKSFQAPLPSSDAEAQYAADGASAAATAPTAAVSSESSSSEEFMPLPESFDIDEIGDHEEAAPMFKDISF